eukprot:TRINITY_DN14805_c0_g1_i1.p1 TRINITY_DN14805_c0_g1~~TRINITY_DN14805_c0_g1_i1.p1  ORF type:complete len:660 (-),score=84.90 TRINITY_DN14805_c0_g1_i1:181-2160(-)
MNSECNVSYNYPKNGSLFAWKVREGDQVDTGQPIVEVDVEGSPAICTIYAPGDGTMKRQLVQPKKALRPEQVLCILEICEHSMQLAGMCAVCGRVLSDSQRSDISISHAHPRLTVSRSQAEKYEEETTKRLLSERKLSLVLDLDNTLVHATTEAFFQQTPWASQVDIAAEDIKHFVLQDSPLRYYVKLRHGLAQYLQEVNKLFELHVYTMGKRQYANQIAEIIADGKNLFYDRVLSRDECHDMNFKTLKRLFPCDDSMVVVVDDREDVWKRSKNLVRIEPFIYFPGGPVVNALPMDKAISSSSTSVSAATEDKGTSANPAESTEANPVVEESQSPPGEMQLPPDHRPEPTSVSPPKHPHWPPAPDNYLACNLAVLREVHRRFFSRVPAVAPLLPDVKAIISAIKSEVFTGCHVVFSALFPMDADPTRTYEWRHVSDFGGTCQRTITPQTTHVVAVKKDTSKVNQARAMSGVWVVHPTWLYTCIKSWRRVNEAHFPLEGVPPPKSPPSRTQSGSTSSRLGSNDAPDLGAPDDDGFTLALRESSGDLDRAPLLGMSQLDEMDREVMDFLDGDDSEGDADANDGDNDQGQNDVENNHRGYKETTEEEEENASEALDDRGRDDSARGKRKRDVEQQRDEELDQDHDEDQEEWARLLEDELTND